MLILANPLLFGFVPKRNTVFEASARFNGREENVKRNRLRFMGGGGASIFAKHLGDPNCKTHDDQSIEKSAALRCHVNLTGDLGRRGAGLGVA